MASAGTKTAGAPPSAFGDGGFGAARKQIEERLVAEEEARRAESQGVDPYAGMTAKERRAAKKAARRLRGRFSDHPVLNAIRPRERYAFRSDYFHIDGSVACILAFFHDEGSNDGFGAFWGINRIPNGLDRSVSVVVLEQVRRMSDKWVEEQFKTVERLDRMEANEQSESGTMRSKRKTVKTMTDMQIASAEIADGASYVHVHDRLLVKAPNLAVLDETVAKIERDYVDRFATIRVAPYHGEQRRELADLFGKNDKKRGKGFHFTSTEFAGSHHLVTNGLNDPGGEYVGYMVGDVNTSAVLLDVDRWDRHVVIADDGRSTSLGRANVADMWGSKLGQSALLANRKVVHIVLDGAKLENLGPRLDSLTARMDLTQGDMNMFEVFGAVDDELALFSQHVRKVQLMTEQAYQATPNELGALRNTLSEVLTEFYVDERMWALNAKENRDRLRLVGIPHKQVPLLQVFVSYLDRKYTGLARTAVRDDAKLAAYSALQGTFKSLLDNNGDLFNNHTSDSIDGVGDASRVIYDFSSLLRRGRGIAMAQLVNVIGFSVSKLGEGDLVVVHGAEYMRGERKAEDGRDPLKDFVSEQFEHLWERGGRVAYLYNSVDKMLADRDFNKFDHADYTILGSMNDNTVKEYQKLLSMVIPPDLEEQVKRKGENLSYLRRGQTNVVFWMDIALGVNTSQKQKQVGLGKKPVARRAKAARGAGTGVSRPDRVDSSTGELAAAEESRSGIKQLATSA